jgi:hypothetical protein
MQPRDVQSGQTQRRPPPEISLPMFIMILVADCLFLAPTTIIVLAIDFFARHGDPFLRLDIPIICGLTIAEIMLIKILRRSENWPSHIMVCGVYIVLGIIGLVLYRAW